MKFETLSPRVHTNQPGTLPDCDCKYDEQSSAQNIAEVFKFSDLQHRYLKLTKLHGRRPQANYTDQATAACRRSLCQPLRVDGVAWSEQRIPPALNLGFLDRSRYFFIQVAPQLSSRG
jgi:hypothetical protein